MQRPLLRMTYCLNLVKELNSNLLLIKTGDCIRDNWISFETVLDEDDSPIECDLPESS